MGGNTVTVRFFAGAARAMGTRELVVELAEPVPLGDLVAGLDSDPERARILGLCTWLVDTRHASDADPVAPGATVDALPPFAGG